jgi:hypothetical protein
LSPGRNSGYSALTQILIARHDRGNLLAMAQLEPPGPHQRWAVALAYQALDRRAEADRALKDLIAHGQLGVPDRTDLCDARPRWPNP